MSRDGDKPRIRIQSGAESDAQWEQLLRQAPPGTMGIDGSAVNDLALAIGCYISTGDHVGEACAMDIGDSYVILILHDPKDAIDAGDFDKLKRRLAGMDGIKLVRASGDDTPPFVAHELHVLKDRVASLAAELVRSCCDSAWGSNYEAIRRVFARDIARIAVGG